MLKKYFFILTIFLTACSDRGNSNRDSIFVSIQPQRNYIERIAGNDFDVVVMIPPGQSPATYEPLPNQLMRLSSAKIYFTIDVPFEKVWIERIRKNNPGLLIVDTQEGIKLRETESYAKITDELDRRLPSDSHIHEFDPHTWLNPGLVKIQAENIYKGLAEINPSEEKKYRDNLLRFHRDLDTLIFRINEILKPMQRREFLVFHPAWGYFADEFNLKQIPVELEGKEPGAKELSLIIDLARRKGLKNIFVQKQFSSKSAEAIAAELGGKIIAIDPLAEDYFLNLISIAEAIKNN